jgi:hypothetical protein
MNELHIADDKIIKITYGALLAVLTGVVGFAVWMALMQSKAEANTESIHQLEALSVDTNKTLISIDKRLQRIEIMLEASSQTRGN